MRKGLNLYFPKDVHQKSEGVSEVQLKKTQHLDLGNVEKPSHPQFSAPRLTQLENLLINILCSE